MKKSQLERYKRMVVAAEFQESIAHSKIHDLNNQISGKREGIEVLKEYLKEMSSPKKSLFPGELQNRAGFLSKVNGAINQELSIIGQLKANLAPLEAEHLAAKQMVMATQKTFEAKRKLFRRFKESKEQDEIDQIYATKH